MSVRETSARFQEVVQAAAARMVSTCPVGESSYVTTPLLYPSGSYVIARVDQHGKGFFVTDFGMGLEEASEIGAERIFRGVARAVADRVGVRFDGHALFELEVSEGQLAGAIAAITNASLEAVATTYMRAADQAYHDENAVLHDRLVHLFTKRFVQKDAEILGGSNTRWHVASLVIINDSIGAFEAVSNHRLSVTSAAVKFGDIARSESAPARVAVVHKKQELGTLLGVLTPAASVLEQNAPDAAIRRILGVAA